MAGSINKVILIGNCGADPEIRRTQDGRPIANLSIATSESWRDKNTGEKRDKTEWHRVVVFNEGLCKVLEQYVTKGSKLYIEGQLQTRKYEKDGIERYTAEVVLQGYGGSLTMLDGKTDQPPPGNDDHLSQPTTDFGTGKPNPDHLDDEIPF